MSMTMIFVQRLTAWPFLMACMMLSAISAISRLGPAMTHLNLPVHAFGFGGSHPWHR